MTNKPTAAEEQAKFVAMSYELAKIAWPTTEAYEKWCEEQGKTISESVRQELDKALSETRIQYKI